MELDRIPGVYQKALELRAAGLDHAGIARELGLDEAAIPNLLRLGDAKATRVRTNADEPHVNTRRQPRPMGAQRRAT